MHKLQLIPMQKLPDCPRCGERELWFTAVGYLGALSFYLRCDLCGYDSGPRLVLPDKSLDRCIAMAVDADRVRES